MSKVCMKATFIALIVGVAVMLSPFTVKALEANPVLEVSSPAGLDDLCSTINSVSQEANKFDFITHGSISSGNQTLTLNMKDYNSDGTSSEERRAIMETALNAVNNNPNISGQSKTRIYNFIASQDTATSSLVRQLSNDVNADFANAYSWFKPFTGGLSTFFGFIAMAIFTLLGIMILLDLSYLTIPLVQYALSRNDTDKPRLVSNEAWIAVREAESKENSGKSYMGIYLKKKSWQIFIISVCLLYLTSGKLYYLVGWIIDSFRGFLG